MGDYYLSLSALTSTKIIASLTPKENTTDSLQTNLEKATTCYTTAAESHHSAQALWNLGWMHENGLGSVSQDFHMAKRYYDLALEMNKEAYLPVKLALAKLRMRSWWNGVSGGKVNGIKDDDSDEDVGKKGKWRGWMDWVNRFLDAAEEMDAREAEQFARDNNGDDELLGYADHDGQNGEYNTRRERAAGVEGDVYGADEWDEFDDGLVESVIIIALAGALALLVYARQARQRVLEAERRQAQNQRDQGQMPVAVNQQQPQPQGQDGGLFPQPGDVDWNNWVAGGIGH